VKKIRRRDSLNRYLGTVANNERFVVKTERLPPLISYQKSAVAEFDPFEWRHYQDEIILLCVRWYLRYALSYRDLEEMTRERYLSVDNTTIYRWVQAYAPELEKRIRPHYAWSINFVLWENKKGKKKQMGNELVWRAYMDLRLIAYNA